METSLNMVVVLLKVFKTVPFAFLDVKINFEMKLKFEVKSSFNYRGHKCGVGTRGVP